MVATLADALKLVEKDPPVGYVSIPIAASQPPAKSIVIRLRGQSLQLPDWSAMEWLWWGGIALRVAAAQPAKNEAGAADKARAIARLRPLMDAMSLLAGQFDEPPPIERVGPFYDAAVRVVLASNAAASGPTAGRLAAEAVGQAFLEVPATIGTFLATVLEDAGEVFFKDLPSAATKLLGSLFNVAAKSVFGLSPAALLLAAAVGYVFLTQRSGHGEV